MKKIVILALTVATLILTGCVTPREQQDYTAFKQSKPRSILVLPPVNSSPDIDASQSMLSVTTFPLAEAGYYVIPVTLANETLKNNGVTVAGQAHEIPIDKLHHIFGADTALYINITKYGSSYQIINSIIEVEAEAKLIDLRSGALLWQGYTYVQDNKNSGSGSSLVGILVNAVVSQVLNSVTDASHKTAKIASHHLLSSGTRNGLLYGPYHPMYNAE